MSTHKLLRQRIHQKLGLPIHTHDDLAESEWSPLFERLMRNRLIMGALRYGVLHEEGKPKYNRVASIIKRLHLYETDGNLEHLVDAANLCLCEFEEGRHDSRRVEALDEHNHHTT